MRLFKKRPKRHEIMNFLNFLIQDSKYQKKIDQKSKELFLCDLGKKEKSKLYFIKKMEDYGPLYKIKLETKHGICENYNGGISFNTGQKESCGMGGMYEIKADYNIECLVKDFDYFKEQIIKNLEDIK